MSASSARARLRDVIAEKSFRQGKLITLASGKQSDFYFNLKPTMMDPQGAALLAEAILEAVRPYAPDFIGGLEMGAVPLVACVAPESFRQDTPIAGFFVRKKPKEHGTSLLIEGLSEDQNLAGKRVVVLEDVTTTAGSAYKAVQSVQDAGGEVVLVLTIVDRKDGAGEFMAEKGLDFASIFTVSDFR
jgi:orotate phosphoribosyltransferase